MQKCPNCNHKLYGEQGKMRVCKFCGYSNNPEHLRRKNENNNNLNSHDNL